MPKKCPRKPRIKDEPVDEKHIPSSRSDKKWPTEASIIYPVSGEVKLTDQHTALAQVVRGAIKALTKYLLWTNAFPPVNSRTKLAQGLLNDAAVETGADVIQTRVNEDKEFVRDLQDLVFLIPHCVWVMMPIALQVLARIAPLRSKLKDSAVKAVTINYGLDENDAQKVTKRVEWWLNHDNYLFPLGKDVSVIHLPGYMLFMTRQGKPIHENPFLNKAIITLLRDEYFHKPGDAGNLHRKSFRSAHKSRKERELPHAMVAIAATAVCHIIYACLVLN